MNDWTTLYLYLILVLFDIWILSKLNSKLIEPIKDIADRRLVLIEDGLKRTWEHLHASSHDLQAVMEKLEIMRVKQSNLIDKIIKE